MACGSVVLGDRWPFPASARASVPDARGVPVSCGDRSARELYERALVQYHSFVGDPIATIEEALGHAPDFVLGHVFRATVLMTMAEAR